MLLGLLALVCAPIELAEAQVGSGRRKGWITIRASGHSLESHLPLSRSSSYGAEAAMLVMSPMADSATRGP